MAVDFEKIQELRQKIRDLIKERSELQKLQDELDEKLSKIPSTDYQRRNQIVQEMMCNEWYKIVDAWYGDKNGKE